MTLKDVKTLRGSMSGCIITLQLEIWQLTEPIAGHASPRHVCTDACSKNADEHIAKGMLDEALSDGRHIVERVSTLQKVCCCLNLHAKDQIKISTEFSEKNAVQAYMHGSKPSAQRLHDAG